MLDKADTHPIMGSGPIVEAGWLPFKKLVAAVSYFHSPNAPAGRQQHERDYDQQSRN